MTWLFDRYAGVTLSKDGKTGKLFENLRVTFEVEKTASSNANTAKINVFNLNDVSIGLIEEGGYLILEVGYNGLPVISNGQKTISPTREILSIGNIANVQTIKQGVDRVTTFEIGDGEKNLNGKTIDKTFPPGVSKKQMVDSLVETLDIAKGVIKGVADEILNNGASLSGKAKDHLDSLTDSMGLSFSVQDNAVQILPKEGSTGDEAILLTPENGLIGSPTRKKGKDGVEFIALLNPQIKPGRKVKIESTAVQGVFVVQKASYSGDTHQGQFIVKGEAK